MSSSPQLTLAKTAEIFAKEVNGIESPGFKLAATVSLVMGNGDVTDEQIVKLTSLAAAWLNSAALVLAGKDSGLFDVPERYGS